jgi:hypothetical protein
MAWHETWDLTAELLRDPTSRVAAAVAEWTHPLSHEGMALRDLYDLLAHVNSGRNKPQPYPRPWDGQQQKPQKLPRERVQAILAARLELSRGHPAPATPDDLEVSRGD